MRGLASALYVSAFAACSEAETLPTCPTVNVSLLATSDTKIAKSSDVFRFKYHTSRISRQFKETYVGISIR